MKALVYTGLEELTYRDEKDPIEKEIQIIILERIINKLFMEDFRFEIKSVKIIIVVLDQVIELML